MSDYLWDKTGEPDEEVERLEALLGTLAHRPRALAPTARAAPTPSRRSRLFTPAALAAAAALLVATLAGAAALLRSRASLEGESTAAGETRPSREEVARERSAPTPEPSHGASGVGASEEGKEVAVVAPAVVVGPGRVAAGGVKDERAAVEDFVRGSRAWTATRVAPAQRRRQRLAPSSRVVAAGGGATADGAGLVTASEAMSAGGGGTPSLFESTRLMTKEQLVYALRLTGAKLRDVRQKTRQGLRQEASEQP